MSLGGSQVGGLNLQLLASDGGPQFAATQALGTLLGSMMGSVDRGGNAALPSCQPSTDELMAAPPLLVTNVGNFGKNMLPGWGGGNITQALLAGAGSSEMVVRHASSLASIDEATEMHKNLLSSSSDSTGRHYHLSTDTGSVSDSLAGGHALGRFLASRSQDETLRRIGRLTRSQHDGPSCKGEAHNAASADLIESMASRMLMGQAAAASGSIGSMDLNTTKATRFCGIPQNVLSDPLQRCLLSMFPAVSQTSGSIENVANFMQVIEMQSLLAASSAPCPFTSSMSSSCSSSSAAASASAAAAAVSASLGSSSFVKPGAPTAEAINYQIEALHAAAARQNLNVGEGANYDVGAKRGAEVLEEMGVGIVSAAASQGKESKVQTQSKGSGAHVKNRPDMQKRARAGQEHWLAQVKKMRQEWSSHEVCSSNPLFQSQIEGCQSVQTRSQHECILRTLQIAFADGQITCMPFASSVDNVHSFLGWTGFQVGAP